jgi:hypothetical protein
MTTTSLGGKICDEFLEKLKDSSRALFIKCRTEGMTPDEAMAIHTACLLELILSIEMSRNFENYDADDLCDRVRRHVDLRHKYFKDKDNVSGQPN